MIDMLSNALPTRRSIMGGLLTAPIAGVLAGCAGGGSDPALAGISTPVSGQGITAAAALRGRRFGSAVGWHARGVEAGSFNNPAYAALLERNCGMIVPENEMKWQALRPAPDQFAFDAFDSIVADAQRRGIAVRGHTLLWHRPEWFPDWLNSYNFGANPAREGERVLTDHIQTVMRRYAGRINSFDVVNETIDTATGGLMSTSLSRALGGTETVLDLAFHTARAEAPATELVYNDYMSWEPGNETHRAGVLRLLEGFRRRNVPVDALGIQSHIRVGDRDAATGRVPRQEREWRAFLDTVTAMGYRLLITELDVADNGLPADASVRDAGVADYLAAYLEVMLSYPQLRDILAWGMADRFSWLQSFTPRADGLPQRCCPYDADYVAKPMHATLIRMLAAAPAI
jgi:endo-1,4-beta-xylanase